LVACAFTLSGILASAVIPLWWNFALHDPATLYNENFVWCSPLAVAIAITAFMTGRTLAIFMQAPRTFVQIWRGAVAGAIVSGVGYLIYSTAVAIFLLSSVHGPSAHMLYEAWYMELAQIVGGAYAAGWLYVAFGIATGIVLGPLMTALTRQQAGKHEAQRPNR
jgi:hypothetical protein